MEIHVVRHTPVNFDKKSCYGQLDVPLADSFEQDVEQIKGQLADAYDKVYCSPLSRCKKLATTLKLDEHDEDSRLLELDFGDWEGMKWNAIDQEILNTWMSDFVNIAPPNGESLSQMHDRLSNFMSDLRKTNHQKVLLITHSGIIRCLWCYFLKFPLSNTFKFPVGFHEHHIFHLGEQAEYDSILKTK